MSTIKNADKIIVLSQGRVVEEGTHWELLSRGGMYTDLVQAQILFPGEKEEEGVGEKTELGIETSLSVEFARSSASLVLEKQSLNPAQPLKYSNFQLIRKVLEVLSFLIS